MVHIKNVFIKWLGFRRKNQDLFCERIAYSTRFFQWGSRCDALGHTSIFLHNMVNLLTLGKKYEILISEAKAFPQAFAAAMPVFNRISGFPKTIVVDIGGLFIDQKGAAGLVGVRHTGKWGHHPL